MDSSSKESWLVKEKKISKQDVKKDKNLKFQFKIKYFPENVVDEIIQDVTLRLLYKQIKNEVISEKIYCPSEKAVMLASYAVQVKFGDHDDDRLEPGFLASEKLLPPKVVSGHNLAMEEWIEKISVFHRQHKGMSREDAMMEYLKIAQDLEMYGITYFNVTNAKGTEVLLGIDALGINIYEKGNRMTPKVSFPWSEIAKVSNKKNTFTIKFTDTKTPANKIKGKEAKVAKKIFYLAAGNHEMYKRRRMPDTLDVQQMKAQRDLERAARERDRERLRRELEARERMERERAEIEARMRQMEEENEARRRELDEALENIRRLEALLEEAQEARDDLERQQQELREMIEKLEESRELDVEEKLRLEEEIRDKEAEIEGIRGRAGSVERLREDLDEERRRIEHMEQVRTGVYSNGSIGRSIDSSRRTSMMSRSLRAESLPQIVNNQAYGDEHREPDIRMETVLRVCSFHWPSDQIIRTIIIPLFAELERRFGRPQDERDRRRPFLQGQFDSGQEQVPDVEGGQVRKHQEKNRYIRKLVN